MDLSSVGTLAFGLTVTFLSVVVRPTAATTSSAGVCFGSVGITTPYTAYQPASERSITAFSFAPTAEPSAADVAGSTDCNASARERAFASLMLLPLTV